jgi:hypothetical protein
MTRPNLTTLDDEVVSLARRYRKEALASLVTVLRDERAPASARAAASAKLLEYSDGKPSQSRQLTVADLGSMPDDLRMQLLEALTNYYVPDGFKRMLAQACEDAVALAHALPKPPKNRFKRGPLAGAPACVPRWPPTPPANAIRSDLSGEAGGGRHATTSQPEAPAVRAAHAAHAPPAVRPANVVQLPGTKAPYGLIYGTAETLEHSQASAPNPHGGIHPSGVERSALKDPLGPFDPWRRS